MSSFWMIIPVRALVVMSLVKVKMSRAAFHWIGAPAGCTVPSALMIIVADMDTAASTGLNINEEDIAVTSRKRSDSLHAACLDNSPFSSLP